MKKVCLGDICKIVSGSTPKSNISEYWDGNIKWITPAEIDEDAYIITDSVRKITELGVKKTGLTYEEIDNILNKKSGLEGIAGMSDLRDIDRAYLAKEKKTILAIDMYTERIAEYITKYFLKLGKVDAIIFTAGGGENDPIIRKEVLTKLKPLGVELDEKLNEETIVRKDKEGLITTENSSIASYVLATDEELVIAKDTYNLSK